MIQKFPEKPVTAYRFFEKLIALPFVEAVYLYGSRARGDAKENSDYDLAVMCPKATEKQWQEIYQLVRHNDETVVRIDCARLDTVTNKIFLNYVIRERQLLYLKDYGGNSQLLEQEIDFFHKWQKSLHDRLVALDAHIAKGDETDPAHVSQAIVLFHAAYDSAWVIVRKCLSLHGMRTTTPLSSFREAYMEGWLSNRLLWEAMVEDYRDTRGAVEADAKLKAYRRLSEYSAAMQSGSEEMQHFIEPYEYAKAQ